MFECPEFLRTFALATDPKAWLIVLIVGAAVLNRSGFFRSRWFDLVKPWRNRPRDPSRPESPRPSPLRDPWFLFLLGISATAVVAWIVMSMTITSQHTR